MKDLSLHVLDLAQNSIRAGATEIQILVNEDVDHNLMQLEIVDNGCGMDKEMQKRIKDPFCTTRTTRRVGLGIPLMEAACERCGGKLEIESELGRGTRINATMEYKNIDRAPLGDMAETFATLVMANDVIDYVYEHRFNDKKFIVNTRELREILGDEVRLSEPAVITWIKEYTTEGINQLYGGVEI